MTRRSFRALVIGTFLILGVSAGPTAASADSDQPHVRTTDTAIQHLLKSGELRSATLRSLLDRLAATDVVVYIRVDATLPRWFTGKTWFVASAAGLRYVEMVVKPIDDPLAMTALIGHELAHALEIAADPGIVDPASMAERFLAIGTVRMRDAHTLVETSFAVKTGQRVSRELSPHRADLLFAARQ
jgi:hypothetical protein